MEDESDLVSFDLVDAKTIKRRIEEGDVRTPFMRTKKYLDIPKDQRWNTKQLNSKLLAGILNGDSIPKIATSLQDVIGNNSAAATRNARTIITGAENAGRKDSYEDLEEQGVIQKKVWIATPDDRTRESHLLMDGEEVDINERFSNGLMYPADPSGDASEVYNCRCTMRTHIIGFKKADGRVEKVGQRDDIGHEAAIAKEQAEREAEAEAKLREKEAREAENEAKRKQEEERREEIDRQEARKEKEPEIKVDVSIEDANEAWFEYENANVMAEYIRTGKMPKEDINGTKLTDMQKAELKKEAELLQEKAETTKTSYKTLYRGMTMSEEDARTTFAPNETYTFDTLTATATDKDIAQIYSNTENSYVDNPVSVIFEIQKSDGIYGYDRDGAEVVMPKGAEFRVVRNYMDKDGIVHISLYAKKGNNVKKK